MKKYLKLLTAITLVMAILTLSGCGVSNKPEAAASDTSVATSSTSTQSNAFSLIIKDSFEREIKIENEPKRIISLAPNITETVFALGQGTKLVGRTDYCDYPAEASKIASVGTLQTPSIEKIAELKPDLVIASTHFSKETLTKLEELKITTVIFYGEENFDGVYDTIINVGKVLNTAEKATGLVEEMKKKVESVKESIQGKDKPSVYYVVGYGKTGDYTAGKNTFIGQLLEMAGAKNAADDVDEWKYSLEKLIEKNPNIMICPKNGGFKQGLETTTGYKDLDAVKNGKLYEIDENLITRQGPRLADGLVELSNLIHQSK